MTKRNCMICLALFALTPILRAKEHDYYEHLRYPKKLKPGVGVDKIEQDGGPEVLGYERRTVEWWPRKGQDIVDIPGGAPLRVWARNKGQDDKEALAGICRSWTVSDPETFKAHLIAFRAFGTSTVNYDARNKFAPIPVAVLRMENGEQRAVHNADWFGMMVSRDDHDFIHKLWEESFPKLHATVSQGDVPMPEGGAPGGSYGDFAFERWEDVAPRFNAMELPGDSKYPRLARNGHNLAIETPHFHLIARPTIWGGPWGQPANWVAPDDPERQNTYRKHVMEFVENLWTYIEASGASMPYWRRPGGNYKYIIHIHGQRAAGGWGHCGIGDCSPHTLGHEFFHGQPPGGWDGHFIETMCNAGQHSTVPSELQMFPGNFCYTWRNVNRMTYQSSLWLFALADDPNWGYGTPMMLGSLASPEEFTPYHTVARLGQKKGLWKNGVKGFGDFFGQYAARLVTCDFVEQDMVRSKYGMPELSYLYPVYEPEEPSASAQRDTPDSLPGLRSGTYRISNAEAPGWCGFNIVRLKASEGAKEIAIDFSGIHDPELYSDWRACIVAVDGNGRARYSPLWNKGKMRFSLEPSDKHLWLTVAATPSAFPVLQSRQRGRWYYDTFLDGTHAPRYPWEVTLTGCRPGLPHRRQGDVVNFDELYGICNNGNKFLDYPIKQEVPIPLTETDGTLARQKLAAMLPRIQASADAVQEKIKSGLYGANDWWVMRKTAILEDMARRAVFLQTNAHGRRHPNGGGFVADNSRVSATAYVGPNAMVLDGARVEDNACIKEFAVVMGPKTVVSGNAKISGRAWVFGDITVSGNARILESATVTTVKRTRHSFTMGRAEITDNAVIKGDPYVFLYGSNLTLGGSVVVDYTAELDNGESGVCTYGRWYRTNQPDVTPPLFGDGTDSGALYANWEFNQPKAVLLEDSYVNNNGILYGNPEFADDGERRFIVFNGKDQYAEAPPSVADFGELTIDMRINNARAEAGNKEQCLFDLGTSKDDCFYLTCAGKTGTLTLVARHRGKNHTVTSSEALPSDEWVSVRVAMNGSEASIYLNRKMAGKGTFEFRPRDVFIGDTPEGNFIARGRNGSGFFEGKMDHFRIYRDVHDDFDAVNPPPFALTQVQEWSEKSQQLAAAWDERRKAREAELSEGKHGEMLVEMKRLTEQRSKIEPARSDDIPELTARIEKLERETRALLQDALKTARLLGDNPYPGKNAAELKDSQQNVVYHTTADWEDRTPEEVLGEIPEKMKKWLQDVRGY